MDDRLTRDETSGATIAPAMPQPSEREARRRPVRVQGAPWIVVALLGAAIAWLAWLAFAPEESGDPVAMSLVAFERQNELTVFSAQLSPVVAAEDSRYFDLVQSRQVAVIPATVSYTLDLSRIDRDRLSWDEATQTLDARLPDIEVGTPNLDEARAQYLREGLWITREAQDELTRKNTQLAERMAVEQADNPVLMDLARQAARDAIRQNLAIPLQTAGFGDVTVNVRFDGESEEPR